ncbi:MAG: flagellar hook-associated protein FlgK [Thermodesulfobacteriota bacterium]|nr:flagellar hook-associated protein FlgK [Thermodesulfobacteriota bacterium]
MSGIGATLNIAKGALAAQQYGLSVTGNNIANVNNADYSVQTADQENNRPVKYAGHVFGNGVNVQQITQSVNQMLEDRLTDEKSSLAAFEESESYMKIVEGMFDETSETSINTLMTDFWNAWHDLSDNPSGPSQREALLESGENLATRFNTAILDLEQLSTETTREIDATLNSINSLAREISDVNKEIISFEASKTANDLRDKRNSLLDELGELININSFELPNGSVSVNVANGAMLVSGVETNELSMVDKEVVWKGSSGQNHVISDEISGGKIKGWLNIRDEIIPKYQAEVNYLAEEMIWAINLQHSQGAGLDYFSDTVTGSYKADASGLLSSFAFGGRIDYSKEFKMWIKDQSTVDTTYQQAEVDMGISEADLTDFDGVSPGGVQSRYKLTVVDGTMVGDYNVTETDGPGLAATWASGVDVETALNGGIVDQTLIVYGSSEGTRKIEVKDIDGDSLRSAASVAEALSSIEGVKAYASENTATFSITDPATGLSTLPDANDGDEVKFSLYVDGLVHEQSFIVDSDKGTLDDQFEDALLTAANNINNINSDEDLFVDGLTITSSGGSTIGVQEFEVTDNAGVKLNNFSNFNEGDTVTFTVDSDGFGSSSATSTNVSVDLNGVDTTDEAAVAAAFYDSLNSALDGSPFFVENDPSTNSIILRTTDGSNLTLKDAGNDSGDDAAIDISPLAGTASDGGNVNDVLDFTLLADDTATFNSTTLANDTIGFNGAAIAEDSAGAVNKAAVITGTVSAVMEPGISIHSTVSGAGSLFDTGAAKTGSSIITLGGDGGFSGFTQSETITFDLDGLTVTYNILAAPPVLGELDHAVNLEADLTLALPAPDYQVIRTGKSVSIIKNKDQDDPIEITGFTESVTDNAKLAVRTGTGKGTAEPDNELLESGSSYRDSSTATLYEDEGVIKWEKLNKDGIFTGDDGFVTVSDDGNVTIDETGGTISFNIAKGSLVAGNTLTVNTDSSGKPDPLDFRIRGNAGSIMDTYHFTVVSGGKVGHVPGEDEEPLTIKWESSTAHGEFEIKGEDPPRTPDVPVEVKVDGMTLVLSDGTLFKDDVFTITTDESGAPVSENSDGMPTGERLSDWHWTLDSFADQFNRSAGGVKASTTHDNRLRFEQDDGFHTISNIEYANEQVSSGAGFSKANTEIIVNNYSAFDFSATDLRFQRSTDSNGTSLWQVLNDPTGGNIQIIPEGGDDDGFGIDLTNDGIADMEIKFQKEVTGDGYVELDFAAKNGNDFSFAFSDDASTASGMMAAAGINTFFAGDDALTMEMNSLLRDSKYIAASLINSETGEISQGDNTNALALADIQFQSQNMKKWTFTRGSDADSSLISATLDEYYSTMIGSMGITLRSIENSRDFSELMVNSITEKRDSVSAVSLDEEMINLMKYQHAFSAASKLISVSDEMLNTILAIR